MKYALLLYAPPRSDRQAPPAPGEPPAAVEIRGEQAWIDYTQAALDAGALLGAEQLHQTETATSVRVRGGERLLTDGPFIETKEHLLGFYLLDVENLDAALDWAARIPLAGEGTIEVRPVVEGMPWQAVLA